ncbi:MAG TPA: Zn-ribbon domain-containing OB-fold protein [Acidimicrobiales bacterium]|jgi:hypothetical protein
MSESPFPETMPSPWVSAHTLPWWQAAAEHRLVVQTCRECGATRHPPAPRCWSCRAPAHEWTELPGTGAVYTFTVVHKSFIPGLEVPHVVAAVELDASGNARLVTNIVGCAPSDVTIGMRVAVTWDDIAPDLSLPRFVPA